MNVEIYNQFAEIITTCNEILWGLISVPILFLQIFDVRKVSWEAQLAYTLGGISSQFPSNFCLFVINPKQGLRGLNYDKKYP